MNVYGLPTSNLMIRRQSLKEEYDNEFGRNAGPPLLAKGSTSTLREASRAKSNSSCSWAGGAGAEDNIQDMTEEQVIQAVKMKLNRGIELPIPNKPSQINTPLILSNRMLYHAAMNNIQHRLRPIKAGPDFEQ